jgi:hypothetical protein
MVNVVFDDFRRELEDVQKRLRESHLNALRDYLKDADVHKACREAGMCFRERVLTPVITVLHMIAAALWPDFSFRSAWQVFGVRHIGSGSLAKARMRICQTVFDKLSAHVASQAAVMSEPWVHWRSHRVITLDGTCVSMEDNPRLKTEFGVPNTRHGMGRYPVARIVVAMLWGTMAVISYAMGNYAAAEQVLAIKMLAQLSAGDLIVGDRHFAGANLYAKYRERGLEFITRAHQRLKIGGLKRVITHGANDVLVHMPVGKAYRQKDPTLPKYMILRIIRVEGRVRGRFETMWLVTSLIDAVKYPAAEIAGLYADRWRIETVFRELKVVSGADILRSKTPDGVRKELAARIMAVNLVRMVMIDAASRYCKEPVRLSFSAALRFVVSTSLRMSTAPVWCLSAIYADMLERVAVENVPERPDRIEPRALTREWKHYPHLRTSRASWRLANVA